MLEQIQDRVCQRMGALSVGLTINKLHQSTPPLFTVVVATGAVALHAHGIVGIRIR